MPNKWDRYEVKPGADRWSQYAVQDDSRPAGLPEGQSLPSVPAHPAVSLKPAIPGYSDPGTATSVARGVLKSIPGTAASVAKLIPGTRDAWEPGEAAAQTYGTAESIGKGIGNAAQFLIPMAGEEAAGVALASKLPTLGRLAAPAGRILASGAGAGIVNKAQGGSFKSGAGMGLAGGAIGEGIRATAPIFAESALGVTGNDKMYGRTVGRAILDDTRGVLPETVTQSARDTVGRLRPELEAEATAAGNAGRTGSMQPARSAVSDRIGGHITNRAVKSADELSDMNSFLHTDAVSNKIIPVDQPPIELLRYKRGLDSDFIGNWKPATNSNNELSTAREAYGKLAEEFHSSAPGTKELDQRISSLIPVIDRADRMSRSPGMLESTLHRFRTPTGALIGATTGGAEGYREHGPIGALTGAALGAIAPAVIGNPATQMLMARGANKFFPSLVRPILVGGTAQALREE